MRGRRYAVYLLYWYKSTDTNAAAAAAAAGALTRMSQFTCFTSTKVQILTLRSCFLQALLSLACLYLQRPSILIFDEPTNHVNFRHLPAVAAAIKSFQGAVLLVSHDSHFVQDVGIESVIDMGKTLDGSEEEEQHDRGSRGERGGRSGSKEDGVRDRDSKRRVVKGAPEREPPPPSQSEADAAKRDLQQASKRLYNIEKEMKKLDASIKVIDAQMMSEATDVAALQRLQNKRDAAAAKVDAAMAEWEQLQQLLSEQSSH